MIFWPECVSARCDHRVTTSAHFWTLFGVLRANIGAENKDWYTLSSEQQNPPQQTAFSAKVRSLCVRSISRDFIKRTWSGVRFRLRIHLENPLELFMLCSTQNSGLVRYFHGWTEGTPRPFKRTQMRFPCRHRWICCVSGLEIETARFARQRISAWLVGSNAHSKYGKRIVPVCPAIISIVIPPGDAAVWVKFIISKGKDQHKTIWTDLIKSRLLECSSSWVRKCYQHLNVSLHPQWCLWNKRCFFFMNYYLAYKE